MQNRFQHIISRNNSQIQTVNVYLWYYNTFVIVGEVSASFLFPAVLIVRQVTESPAPLFYMDIRVIAVVIVNAPVVKVG